MFLAQAQRSTKAFCAPIARIRLQAEEKTGKKALVMSYLRGEDDRLVVASELENLKLLQPILSRRWSCQGAAKLSDEAGEPSCNLSSPGPQRVEQLVVGTVQVTA